VPWSDAGGGNSGRWETNPCSRSHYRLHKRRRSGVKAPSSLVLIRCSRLHLQISTAQRQPSPVSPSARETAVRLFQKYTQAQLKTMKARQPPFWLVDDDRHSRRQKIGPGWLGNGYCRTVHPQSSFYVRLQVFHGMYGIKNTESTLLVLTAFGLLALDLGIRRF
jgi:hypothetical protein